MTVPVLMTLALAAAQPIPSGWDYCINAAVFFSPGSAELNGQARSILDQFRAFLARLAEEEMIFIAYGYADSSGSPAANMRLSQRRARAVASYLGFDALPSHRIRVSGYGEEQPSSPPEGETGESRAFDRRVNFGYAAPDEHFGNVRC